MRTTTIFTTVIIPSGRMRCLHLREKQTLKFNRILTDRALVKGVPGGSTFLRKGKSWQENSGNAYDFANFAKHKYCQGR